MGNVLVTGANGFVGRSVVDRLRASGWSVVSGVRDANSPIPSDSVMYLGPLSLYRSEALSLKGLDAIVHLAARVHRMNSQEESVYIAENCDATIELARGAARDGVRHFLFVSTIKANGESTLPHRPFRSDDSPAPQDAYARSKAMAEEALRQIEQATGMAVTIIRPPLIYGPGVRANFARLVSLSTRRWVTVKVGRTNRRSMIYVGNLADAIGSSLLQPAAFGKTYLVQDSSPLTPAQVIQQIRRASGSRGVAVSVPDSAVRSASRLLRSPGIAHRLLGSLTVDDRPIRRDLAWRPPFTASQGLTATLHGSAPPKKLLLFITEDWYFWSHRRNLARAAIDRGWEVHLACNVTDHGPLIEDMGIHLHPLPLVRRSANPLGELRLLRSVTALMQQIGPDVVHNVALKPILYGAAAARATGVPRTINAIAGLGSVFSEGEDNLRSRVVSTAFRAASSGPNTWVVVQNSDDLAFLQRRAIGHPERRRLIPGSGVDTEEFAYSPPPAGDIIVATFVGRMLWDKGVGEAVAAARILASRGSPVRIRLVGDPDPENPNSIPLEELRNWADEGVIEWHGHREDISEVWASSDLALLPSYREGMPKSLLEAASVGRPLVATDVPGCRDLVDVGLTGYLVPSKDPHAIADALGLLAEAPELRLTQGANARASMLHLYSTEAITAQFLALYEETEQSGAQPSRDLRPPYPL